MNEQPATASLASVYAFGIRTSQAIFVQDTISLFADPLFERLVAALGIDDPAGCSSNNGNGNGHGNNGGHGNSHGSTNGSNNGNTSNGGNAAGGTFYRALRVLFRFLVAVVSIRCVGFALGIR